MNKQYKYLQQTKSRLLALLIVLFLGVSEMASLFAQTIVPEGALPGLFSVSATE